MIYSLKPYARLRYSLGGNRPSQTTNLFFIYTNYFFSKIKKKKKQSGFPFKLLYPKLPHSYIAIFFF